MKITAIKTFMGLFSGRNRGLIKVETDEGYPRLGRGVFHWPRPVDRAHCRLHLRNDQGRRPPSHRVHHAQTHPAIPLSPWRRRPSGEFGQLTTPCGTSPARPRACRCTCCWAAPAATGCACNQGAGGRNGEEAANSARRLNEEWGFTAFKTSPFLLNPDVARWGRICAEAAKYFEEIRQHAPADFEFAFDPHAKIFEPVRALQLANALAPYDPYFYEEPLRPEHTACLGAAAPADADPFGYRRVPLHPLGIPRPDGGPKPWTSSSRMCAFVAACSKCAKSPPLPRPTTSL